MDLGNRILTSFAGGHDLSGIQAAVRHLASEIEKDNSIKEFFSDINRFVQRSLKEEGFILTDQADSEAHQLYERGKQLTVHNKKYNEAMDNVRDEFEAFFHAVRDDRGNRRLALAGMKVFDDFTTAEGRFDVWRDFGKAQIFPSLCPSVLTTVDVVLPKAISFVRYVPIPRIEYQDAQIDLVIENLVFESDSFLPRKLRIDSKSHAEFRNSYTFESEYCTTIVARVDGFRIRAKDISFAFRKKTGFLKFEDKGILDVFVLYYCERTELLDGQGGSFGGD